MRVVFGVGREVCLYYRLEFGFVVVVFENRVVMVIVEDEGFVV